MCAVCVREHVLEGGFDVDELVSALSRPDGHEAGGQEGQQAPVHPEGAGHGDGSSPADEHEHAGNGTTVVNLRTSPYDIYIGRPGPWGNPFRGEGAVENYRQWLWGRIQDGSLSLEQLASLRGHRLGCYCKPAPCHGDVLAGAAEWAAQRLGL